MSETIVSPINDDRFEIVKSGYSFWPGLTVTGGGAGSWAAGEAITTIAHGLGFTPVIVAFLQEVGSTTLNFVTPSFSYFGLGTRAIWLNFQVAADATNVYIINDMMIYGFTGGNTIPGGVNGGFNCQYYLLQERIKRTS